MLVKTFSGAYSTPQKLIPKEYMEVFWQPLHPAAMAFVPYGIVLVRVRVRAAMRYKCGYAEVAEVRAVSNMK